MTRPNESKCEALSHPNLLISLVSPSGFEPETY
jgi:hypothetical protein